MIVWFYPGYISGVQTFHKFLTIDALQLLHTLAIRTVNRIKGASYINSDGKHIELTDNTTIAKSKKEIRDASGVYLC